MAKLLIVESPGKLKTLRKILGSDWILEASVGHTTELASDGPKRLGFDLKGDRVETRYVPRGPRGRQVLSKLRAAAKQADMVYLATDPDREGEAIAWHLVEQLRLKKFVRVSYTQITERAVKAAIQQPRQLDFPLIHAQRARQCLDKLVGFEVSPLLWSSTGGKSAGRVQSATLHLVCERERERLAFKPTDYWTLQAHYVEGLTARYEPAKPSAAQDEEPGRVLSEQEAKRIESIARSHPHIVNKVEHREELRRPLPPLITSSLQQTAGVRLKSSPQKTMKIAQELYEGIGGRGLITYMRTDAINLSPEFVQEARSWLHDNAPSALADQAPTFRAKSDAQGAHEAIRPTSVELTPEKARAMLNHEQYEIYRLIWERAIASQCKPARLSRGQVEILSGETRWIARGMRVLDPGYLAFWRNIEDEKELPQVQLKQALGLTDIKTDKKTTQPPSRYSEAKLVQLMEKLGIGRPSTYASTVMTLKDRDYVVLDKGVLAPTELGMATDEVLSRALPDLVDVRFTAQMEESLDRIAEDQLGWEKYLCEWSSQYLREALASARSRLAEMRPQRVAPAYVPARAKTARANTTRRSQGSKTRRRKNGAAAQLGPAPNCDKGHGPLEQRISKKGDAYWKCARAGCDSWGWPHSKRSTE